MTLRPAEYLYSYGHRTRDDAIDAIEAMFASGEVSQAESPRAVIYLTRDRRRLYAVALTDTALAAYAPQRPGEAS